MVEVKHASLGIALAFLTFAYVPASLIGPWVGRLSDRVGSRRPFLIAGEAAALPLFLAIGFAPGYLWAGGLFIAAEIVLAIGGPAYTAYVSDVTRSDERGYGYGLLNATSSAGAVAGFVLAGVVTYFDGLSTLFLFVAAVSAGSLVIVVLLVPEGRIAPSRRPRPPLSELVPLVRFSFAVSIRALGSGAIAGFLGYYASTLGANTFEVGLVAITGLLAMAIVSLPLGRVIDRRGEIRGIWYGTVLGLVSYVGMAFSVDWRDLLATNPVRGAGLSLVGPGMLAWVARMAPPDRRAEYQGVFALINSSMWSVGPLVGAGAIGLGGFTGLFILAIVTTAVSLGVMEFWYGEMGIRSRITGRTIVGPRGAAGSLDPPERAPPAE